MERAGSAGGSSPYSPTPTTPMTPAASTATTSAATPERGGGEPVTVHHIDAAEFRGRLTELVRVYVAAMRYPEGLLAPRVALWTEHSHRDGFAAVLAETAGGDACAIGYGYTGRPGQWWFEEVRRGLGDGPTDWLTDFFELTELHVRPDQQGGGLGQRVLTDLLGGRSEATVLLSTPEGTNRAWRLYRRVGFVDVLRHYRFNGDIRPFAVLGRSLPLPPVPIRP